MKKPKAIFNWSGGKDSSLCLHALKENNEYDITALLTSVNESYQRVSMHGVRVELLERQAQSIGLPLKKLMLPEMPSMTVYDELLHQTWKEMKDQGIEYSIFGDIFLEDLREYREKQLEKVQIKGVFPLWNKPTSYLIDRFIDLGFKAVLVCVNEKYLDKSFAGRNLDKDFLKDLPKNVDPCGENGEYHSFVYDGPIFQKPIPFTIGEVVYRNYQAPKESDKQDDTCFSRSPTNHDTGFWFCDLLEN
ncbi:MAG TPA: diphthine--ammonia ligase [Cytophagaceae bacterium]|jgi:uncharacterized protein (TIGR00290 family)